MTCAQWTVTSMAWFDARSRRSGAVSLNVSRRHRPRRPTAGRRVSQSTERLLRTFFGLWTLVEALNEVRPQPRRVGIIGLGAGVLASYGRKGDEFTFYEISPRVVDMANDEFTFLRYSAANIQVVLGDGRLSLERAAPLGL